MNEDSGDFRCLVARSVGVARKRIEIEDEYAQISDEARDRALNVLSYALKIPEIWDDTHKLLRAMIPKMEMAGHRGDWIPYLERGVALSRSQKGLAGHGDLCLAIGYLELLRMNLHAADTWFTQSLKSFIQVGDNSGHGRALNRLAIVELRNQNYQASTDLASRAHALLSENDPEQANNYFVFGATCEGKRHWIAAEKYHRMALSIWEKENDLRRIAWGLRNLGPALYEQGEYEGAVSCYKRALGIFDHIHDPANKASVQLNLAIVYWRQKQHSDAAYLYTETQKIFSILRDELNLARATLNHGLNYAAMEHWNLAQSEYQKSIDLWQKLGIRISLCNTLDCLGETYLATKDYQRASEIFQEGLRELEAIGNHPRYEYLRDMLTGHLIQAMERQEA